MRVDARVDAKVDASFYVMQTLTSYFFWGIDDFNCTLSKQEVVAGVFAGL
jgi:hypothetical protein